MIKGEGKNPQHWKWLLSDCITFCYPPRIDWFIHSFIFATYTPLEFHFSQWWDPHNFWGFWIVVGHDYSKREGHWRYLSCCISTRLVLGLPLELPAAARSFPSSGWNKSFWIGTGMVLTISFAVWDLHLGRRTKWSLISLLMWLELIHSKVGKGRNEFHIFITSATWQ